MKYLYKNFVKDIDLSELDLINQDEIFGRNDDGHEYDTIIVHRKNTNGYYDECEEINIDTAIETLQALKKAGANHAQILAHNDHNGYEFYGIEMREATLDEANTFLELEDKKRVAIKTSKIIELEKEIKELKK